jgi:hypothetical protein
MTELILCGLCCFIVGAIWGASGIASSWEKECKSGVCKIGGKFYRCEEIKP